MTSALFEDDEDAKSHNNEDAEDGGNAADVDEKRLRQLMCVTSR